MPEYLQRLFSAFLLFLFFPLVLIIALCVFFSSKGPVIHKRVVSGKDDEVFAFWKFRTMRYNADDILKEWEKDNHQLYLEYLKNIKLPNDPRITKIGKILRKYSLDELPQLYNVIQGKMNLIGPRPVAKEDIDKYSPELYALRRTVKPGLTGYWQVSGRQDLSYNERINMDMFYIKHRSFKLDAIILLKTIHVVIFHKGAH